MDLVCKDKLWDHELTWGNHRKYPMFTECFQDLVLGTVPSIILLCIFPLYYYSLTRTKDGAMERSWLYQAKMGVTVVLLALRSNVLFDSVGFTVSLNTDFNLARYISQSLEALTLLTTMYLVELERKKNYVTSVVLTLHWFFTSTCGIVILYCKMMEPDGISDIEMLTTQATVACYVLQLVLHNFSEPAFVQTGKRPSSLQRASFISKLHYGWAARSLSNGYKKPLDDNDFDSVMDEDQCSTAAAELLENWEIEKQNQTQDEKHVHVSLFRVLFRTYAFDLMANNLLRFLDLLTDVGRHSTVGLLVWFADTPDQPSWKAFVYVGAFFLVHFVSSVNFNYIIYQCGHMAKRMRAGLNNTIFQKGMKLSNRSRAEKTVGDITNLASEDVETLKHWMAFFWVVWSLPIEFLSYTVLLYVILGKAVFVSLAVLVMAVPFNSYIAKRGHVINKERMDLKDERTKLLTEILNGIQFLSYTVLLYVILGKAVFVSLAVLVMAVPFNSYIAKRGHVINKERMDLKDERTKLLTEILNGIQVLKQYAWELSFGDKVISIRDKELRILMKQKLFGCICHIIWFAAPFLMAFASFTTYIYMEEGNVLTASTAFMAISVFGNMNGVFSHMPHVFAHFMKAYTSLKRLDEFLNKEEIDPDDITHEESDAAIKITNGQFTWDPKLGPCLKNINLEVRRGELVAVFGKIGAGKSSLLSAILGEMGKDVGAVNIQGTTAYVPQQAWIQNATLKNNILFGEKVRQRTYDEVISACALTKDLERFKAGDQTEIGEKGINLSGGQKQRVSLARAVYSNAAIYLLDDPLSAVDAHVGKHIFDHVISKDGFLRNKTRILVTHGLTWLPHVDRIIVIDNKKIVEEGHYDQLLKAKGVFAKFIKEFSLNKNQFETHDSVHEITETIQEEVSSESDTERDVYPQTPTSTSVGSPSFIEFSRHIGESRRRTTFRRTISRAFSFEDKQLQPSHSNMSTDEHGNKRPLFPGHDDYCRSSSSNSGKVTHVKDSIKDSGKFMEDDEEAEGNVKLHHLTAYFKVIGHNYVILALSALLLIRFIDSVGDINIKNWTSDKDLQNSKAFSGDPDSRMEKNYEYIKLYAYTGVARLICEVTFQLVLLFRVIHAADVIHSKMLRNVLRGPMAFFHTTPVGKIVHRFSSDLEPLDGALDGYGRWFTNCVLDFFKVLFVMTYSIPKFIATLPPIVLAYYYIQKYFVPTRRQISRMRSSRRSPVTSHFSEALNGTSVIRAFSKQDQFIKESAKKVDSWNELEFMDLGIERWLSVRLDLMHSGCIVGTVLLCLTDRESLTGPLLGLALGTAGLLHGALHGFVRSYSEMQKNLVCLEKVDEYSTKQTEAALHTETKPADPWPNKGAIEMNSLSMRYREGQDLILKGITLSIRPGERIGVVGTTGSGKSSLMTVALFRLFEAAEGSIKIDGYDIHDLGLYDLRGNLTILPQDPVLFSGTLRINLDPLGQHSDESLYNALKHAHLKPFVDTLPDKLDYQCGEGGQNLSVGQRQLICLARSLLRKSKILVLDEATANVDMETDELIQTTIKTEFKECTVLTIAHRLNTIIDYDRILVLDKGEVKEFDAPKVLLANTKGVFFGMARDANIV